ncbi:crotonobetainyl-CoA:carnitine CoA-transferase CaiB-like acyl-CoA transferase [Geodermatophilus bullaregiensis]|uniref:CaiB/BaiF CoA transferase family protein n=1 Tax=Geodermatophilus bullaregiensis TaxID=1564160 RepID=UPI00195CE90A|nr:CoA transferase [Geodermatophilus bullaregiensis]MBM7807940.1 crotonobetainyl-CoA:carnitine CoA-transferase CaiB-like acyl-CoA transferase [Geodermatophilus bullaregiensis]
MAAPLEGVRVVEVATWMAAPGAAALMADMGADVVKVEPLRGDPMRGATRQPRVPEGEAPVDAAFQMDNRGKRSIAVALDEAQGADLVRRLAARADVFLCNLLPTRQARFGLDAPALHALNPRLVHATLTGYGPSGPDAARPGYDLTAFFGRGAVLDAMSEPANSAPPRLRPAQGDHTAALALFGGVLAALRLVEATGEGQVVDVSLLAAAAWTMSSDLSATLVDGVTPTPQGRIARPHALHGGFRCADRRWILLFMPEPRWWPPFCETVGHPEWVDDERFATVGARAANMPELTRLMDDAFATRPLSEWSALFDERGFIWGPASTVSEFAADEQAAADGLFPTIEEPSGRRFRTVRAPLRLRGGDVGPRGPAPGVGEHTAAVLTELGVTGDDLAALTRDGVIA